MGPSETYSLRLVPALGLGTRGSADRSPNSRPLALVVDDDSHTRHQLVRELVLQGYEVETTGDAKKAAGVALERRPVLVVLELQTRAASGLRLLAELRPQIPTTKFVVLTNYGSVASAVRAMSLGATNYLCKPASIAEVLRAANEVTTNDGSWPALRPALTLDEAIWEYIHRTIEDSGSISEAARRLGLFRQSLKRMISKYRPSAGA